MFFDGSLVSFLTARVWMWADPAKLCMVQGSATMIASLSEDRTALLRQIEARVRETTYGRIRGLCVQDEDGQVVIRGRVPSHHAKQLALQAALELVSGEGFRDCITVG